MECDVLVKKTVGYTMVVIGAEVTFWCILASMIFKRIHMDKLQKNSVSVVFWIIYSLLLRWYCTYIGTAEDFTQVVEETQILLLVVFLLILLFVYGKDWSTIDGVD